MHDPVFSKGTFFENTYQQISLTKKKKKILIQGTWISNVYVWSVREDCLFLFKLFIVATGYYLSHAPERQLFVAEDSARIQHQFPESSACFLYVLDV